MSTIHETIELLPAREALFWGRSVRKTANVYANNQSAAINLLAIGSTATSGAFQSIVVVQ